MSGRGRAEIATVEFEWSDLPEDLKQNLREQLFDEIVETAPVEEVSRRAAEIEAEDQAPQSSSEELGGTVASNLTDEQLQTIAEHLARGGVVDDVVNEAGSSNTQDVNGANDPIKDLESNVYRPFLRWSAIGLCVLGVLLISQSSILAIPVLLASGLAFWGWRIYCG